MLRILALVACLAVAGALAWAASRTPAPLPANAPAQQFSAARAFADIQAIGSKPHPSGSAEHGRVRDDLVSRCRALGLQTRIRPGAAIDRVVYPGGVYVEGGDEEDVVCLLPGLDRQAPAVALMAHYDTVAGSPGASDDSANVAAALEIARAIKASGPKQHDLVLVLTDGEEDGMIGARVFFDSDPLARRIGAVLNMETEGSSGRALMFQTGRQDGGMVWLLQRIAVQPTASSLAGYIYSKMPNDTDFTVTRGLGYPGFNYAFIGGRFDYHAPSSTPPTVSLGSVQHMGDEVLPVARGLLQAGQLPGKSADAVYQDLLGGPVVAYPALAGWVLILADLALLVLAFRRAVPDEPFSWPSALKGAAAVAVILPVTGALLYLVRVGTGAPFDFAEEKALMARFDLYEVALAAACLGGALLVFRVAGIGQNRFRSAFAGACGLMFVIAVALQIFAPLAAFIVAWPVAAAGIIALAMVGRGRDSGVGRNALILAAVLAVPVVAELAYIAHPIALAVGAQLPYALAAPAAIASLVLFPLLWPTGEVRPGLILCILSLLGAAVLTLFLRLSSPWSERHPRPVEMVYAAEPQSRRFLLASPLPELDAWTRSILGAGVRRVSLAPFARRAYAAPGNPASVPPPSVLENRKGQRVTLRLAPGASPREVELEMSCSTAAAGLTVNGQPAVDSLAPGARAVIRWHAPQRPLTLAFRSPAGSACQLHFAKVVDGWPPGAPPLPKLPPTAMAWGDFGSTVLLGSASYRW